MIHNNNYTVIPFANNYSISRDGRVINNQNGNQQTIRRSTATNKLMVNVINNNGYSRTMSLAYTLAKTFISGSITEDGIELWVHCKDGNKDNLDLNNLEWRPRNYERDTKFISNVIENRSKHNVPEFTREVNGYYPNNIECSSKPGYYFIPESDHPLVISKKGEVFNLETESVIKHLNAAGGYKAIAIRNNGKYKNIYFHRLIASLFIAKPERHCDKNIKDLEVNHIDGNKTNNSLANLEWVTPSENIKHAINTKLFDFKTVLARDINTNIIYSFPTADACATKFGIQKSGFVKRLHTGQAGYITKNWCVFKYDDNKPWPKLENKHYIETRWYIYSGVWYAFNTSTKQLVLDNTLNKLLITIGIDTVNISKFDYTNGGINKVFNWEIRYDDDPESKDYLKVNSDNIKIVKANKSIRILNLKTHERFTTLSLNEAARRTDVKATTLSLNLSKKNGTAILNNYLFESF